MTESGIVLGFHGCEQSIGRKIIEGDEELILSEKNHEWLGHGAYFWENSPLRALQWAKDPRHKIKVPFILGAIIISGNCLDLTVAECLEDIRNAYEALRRIISAANEPLPENLPGFSGDTDRVKRVLDCAVINYVHEARRGRPGYPSYDTVRAPLYEGGDLYPGAGFKARTHVQICVRDPSKSVRGYFKYRAADAMIAY
jgi:hypothetical protein